MLEVEDAIETILAAVPPVQLEQVALSDAQGRITAQAVVSPIELPPFDNSAMDGYAARAADLVAAKKDAPVRLRVAGIVAAGEVFPGELSPGNCVRLFTGSALPRGADCVVMQEDTSVDTTNADDLLVLETARLWENVRLKGADLHVGAPLVRAGQSLGAAHLYLLAATGLSHVTAGRQPVVGLIATGSELCEPGRALEPGCIYESNRVGLAALIRQAGGKPVSFPVVGDTLEDTNRALALAFRQCDLVVSAGGASVGDLDLIKPALAQIGGQIEFWRVAMRPGRPFIFGRFHEKLFFGLPGNPVSAFVTFLILVRPALKRWQGATEVGLLGVSGTLAEPVHNPGLRRHFMRVQMDDKGTVSLAGAQDSHVLSSLAEADGLLDVPAETTLRAGSAVVVRTWQA